MIRWATNASRLLPTLAILVVWYLTTTTPLSGKERDLVRRQNESNVTVGNENPGATAGPPVTYGSDKRNPEFVPKRERGARILLLAYARYEGGNSI